MKTAKNMLIGFVLGVVVVGSASVYYFMNQPRPSQIQLTQEQKWATDHKEEMTWTMQRYAKFQQAAHDAFLTDDVATIKPSK